MMPELTCDQETMLAFLHLTDECSKEKREWEIRHIGGEFHVRIAPLNKTWSVNLSAKDAIFGAMRSAGMMFDGQ